MLVVFNLFGQSSDNYPNLTKEPSAMSSDNSYNPFVVDLETWYDHPDQTLSFKIDYTPIAGTTLSPYGLVCRINGQFKIGPYGGPIREIFIVHDSHMQVVSDPSLIIDLRIENKWIQAHYNGKMLPLFFNRNEATVFGVWSASHPMETSTPTTANPIYNPYGKEICVSCAGIGSRQCSFCAGTGYTTESVQKSEWNSNTQSYEYRYVHEQRTCIRCSGGGRINCNWCNGTGYKL